MRLRDIDMSVLCGLMKHPELSLSGLSEKLEMNYWTLYKIVEKFRKLKIIREVAIPNFKVLKKELFVAGYGNLTKRKMVSMENMKKMRKMKFGETFSADIFYGFAESYRGFVFALSQNFTEIKKSLIYAERMVGLRSMVEEENMSLVILPFELAQFPIFFDYSMLLCDAEHKPPTHRGLPEPERSAVSERELQAMYAISEDPGISISRLSEKIGTTPQTASKMRKRLYEERLLIRRYIPDLAALGYDVLVFAHWFTDPDAMDKMKNLSVDDLEVDLSPIIFIGYDMLEGVALAPFKSLQKSREIISFFENFGAKTGVLTREPRILFLSLQEGVRIKEHSYSSLIRQVTG